MGMNFRNVDCGEKPKGNGGVKRLAHREQTSSLRVEARKLASPYNLLLGKLLGPSKPQRFHWSSPSSLLGDY